MAAVSDVLPSPGAPVTDGTIAVTGPSRPMLPVVGLGRCRGRRAGRCLAAVGALGCRGRAALRPLAVRRRSMAAPDGDGAWLLWLGSQATKELAALPAIDCATCGVSAAHGSLLAALAETTSSPVMRLTRLPDGSVTSQM